ncbi:hypothetical protein B1A87_003015 [Arthrobacter sp. KBS0703]|nr:hypothetical protein B1A87_003015 [Arthrobacter sp. KBS0703]
MKKLIAPALLAVLALTGCSAAATPAPAASPAVSVAKPTEAQKTALMSDLAKVNPQLEGPRVLAIATLSCRSILKGEPEGVQIMAVRDRFSRVSDKPITDPDAKRIIEVIKTNGFCVKA